MEGDGAFASSSDAAVAQELLSIDGQIAALQKRRVELLMVQRVLRRDALGQSGDDDSRQQSMAASVQGSTSMVKTPSGQLAVDGTGMDGSCVVSWSVPAARISQQPLPSSTATTQVSSVAVSEVVHVAGSVSAVIKRGRDEEDFADLDQDQADISDDRYAHETFRWSEMMREAATHVWNINSFRPNQLPIMNATLDGQDVVVIMSTGSGKSLCFQLPALMDDGLTLVISPLISLIIDQVMDLQEHGVLADHLSGGTPPDHAKRIMQKLRAMAQPPRAHNKHDELALLYVTPEKVARSQQLKAVLERLYAAGRLSRVVIDEAHCCSQYGHDFRPDYKMLGVLKMQFPRTPLIALTATCPAFLLDSIMSILHLHPQKTLVYSGSLNRPNLHFSVVSKPTSHAACIKWIIDYIKEKHANESGIIYCFTKKDTQNVCEAIVKESRGVIRCAVYNSDTDFQDKERIQMAWRKGKIDVVVATIAFGMGINHPRVRFVIHHSMSKSLEGYYQESGRAGRDGKPADCVIMYRGQDAMRLSPLVYHDSEGMRNVFEMSRYCNSITTCRRTLMRSYFGRVEHTLQSAYQRRGANAATASTAVSSRLESINRWTLPAEAIVNGDHADICQGKCDICDGSVFGDTTYDDGTPKRKLTMIDMTFHAFVLCTILDVMSQTYEEKVTQAKLMDIWHGRLSGFKNRNALDELKAQFALAPEVDGSEVDGEAASVPFPLDKKFISEEAEVVCSGVECHYGLRGLSFRDAPHSHNITKPQRLIVQLMLDGLIEQEFHNTAYSTVVYLRAGAKGRQLVRCLQDHRPLPSWWQPRFEMMMDVPKPKKSNASVSSSKRQKVTNVVSASSKVVEDSFEPSVPVKRKRASKKPPVTQTTLDEFKGKKQAAIDALADIKGKSKAVSSAEPHKPDSDFHIDDGVDLDAFDHADTFDLPEDLFDESLFTKESGNITNAVVFTPTEKLSSKKRLSALKSTLGRSIPRAAIIHVESDDNDGDEDLPAVAISSRHPAANTQPRAATVTIDWNSSDDDFDVNDSSVGGKAAPATNDDWTFS